MMKVFLWAGAAAPIAGGILLGGSPSSSGGEELAAHFQTQLEDRSHRTRFGTRHGGPERHFFRGVLEKHLVTLPPGLSPDKDWRAALFSMDRKGSGAAAPRALLGWESWFRTDMKPRKAPPREGAAIYFSGPWFGTNEEVLKEKFPVTPFLRSAAVKLAKNPRQVIRGSAGPIKLEARALVLTKTECLSCHQGKKVGDAAGLLLWESGRPSKNTKSFRQLPHRAGSAVNALPLYGKFTPQPVKVAPSLGGSAAGRRLHELVSGAIEDINALKEYSPEGSAGYVVIPFRHEYRSRADQKVPGVWRLDTFNWLGVFSADGRSWPGVKVIVSELLPKNATQKEVDAMNRGMASVRVKAEERHKKGDKKLIKASAGPLLIEARPLVVKTLECRSCHALNKGDVYGYSVVRINPSMKERWRKPWPR